MLNLNQSLEQYESALKVLEDDKLQQNPLKILNTLKMRDSIQTIITDKMPDNPDALLHLIELDEQLKTLAPRIAHEVKLADWRCSFSPPEKFWWWFLDNQAAENTKRRQIMWGIVAGTLFVFIAALSLEIIKRLWTGAPDTISVWATILTLLLTASPFVKWDRELVQWLVKPLSFIKTKYYSESIATLAGFALLILLVARLWLLPGPLTTYYNNSGIEARSNGNLSVAQQSFQRAAALNPDRVVPYQNLAEAYRDAGIEDKAIEWYEKAIERDANFVPAFRGLGAIYNQQGKFVDAERVLLAGLSVRLNNSDEVLKNVTQYELLANLGWSYWGQGKLMLAQTTFEDALTMETELQTLGAAIGAEYRLALPHFFLAQLYEQAGRPDLAREQWETSLRFLDQANWRQAERYQIAQQHLQELINR